MLFTAGFALVFSSLAAAQDYGGGGPVTPTTTAATPVPSALANSTGHINVDVAPNGILVFNPNNFNASVGTVVTFFIPNAGLQHSVTQSSFADPCTPLAATANSSAGFDSGLTLGDQFSINITDDTKPIWFHCKQVTHCGMGMVGSINAPTTGNNTFDAFMANAKAIGAKGEPTEADHGPVLSGVNAIATASPSNTAGAPPAQTGSAMRVGTSIAAVLLGGAAVIAML